MTPKEKAKELVKQLYGCMPFKDFKLGSCLEDESLIIEMEMLSAKQCALIAVDELIEAIKEFNFIYSFPPIHFWEQVKQEIKKL